jgi:outer membrane murein-binding lipoprotein Lpp
MKYLVVLMTALFLLAGCTDKEKITRLQEQASQLQAENQMLNKQSELKDHFIEEYTRTLNEVYDNLDNIRKRERLLTKYSQDMERDKKVTLKDEMLTNIRSIDNYIKDSKKRLNQLKEKLYSSQLQTASLEEMIEKLKNTLDEKEKYISKLKNNVEELNARVAVMEDEIQEKTDLIDEQTQAINTAYYIISNEKDLKDKGIIEEKGGIFGIRKTKKLAANFNTDYFQPTDVTSTQEIPIDQKPDKVRIISPHNPESYRLLPEDENESKLEILNPDEFWKIKYLVVLTKD